MNNDIVTRLRAVFHNDRILAQTRGLSGATPNATQLIEELRSALEENMKEVQRLRKEESK